MTRICRLLAVLLAVMMVAGVALAEPMAELPTQGRLSIRDIHVRMNDEEQVLDPSLHAGFSSSQEDGECVLDFHIDTKDGRLLPVQVVLSAADGVTVLFENAQAGLRIPAEALQEALGQLLGTADLSRIDTGALAEQLAGNDPDAAFVVGELMPAYMDLLKAMQDPEAQAKFQQAMQDALMAEVGEAQGVDAAFEIGDVRYEGQEVTYELTIEQLMRAEVAAMQAVPEAARFWEVYEGYFVGKIAESGIEGVESFADLFAKLGISMDARISVTTAENDEAYYVDITETIYKAEDAEGELAAEIPDFEPMVVYTTVFAAGEDVSANVHFDYEVEGQSMSMIMSANQDADGQNMILSMNVFDVESGESIVGVESQMNQTGAEYDGFIHYNLGAQTSVAFGVNGEARENGEGAGQLEISVENNGQSFGCLMNYAYDGEPVAKTESGDAEILVLEHLVGDEAANLQSQLMPFAIKVSGAMSSDLMKLSQDEGVAALLNMIQSAAEASLAQYAEDDYEEYEYEEPEDDGVLAYDMPEFTWLPEGWYVEDTYVDTAYDSVSITLRGADDDSRIYAYFGQNYQNEENFTLAEDGSMVRQEGRNVVVIRSDDDGSLDVRMTENGRNNQFYVYAEDLDMDTIGQILNGLK